MEKRITVIEALKFYWDCVESMLLAIPDEVLGKTKNNQNGI